MRRFKCKGFVFGAVASVGLAASAATQQIVLDAGWNLVSVQVGTTPWTIADIEAAIDADNVLNAVWGYDAATGTWKTCQPMRAGFPNDLSEIRQGSGYWVKVNEACVLTLDGEPWEGTVELRPGWNLVGFPGLGASNLASFFGNALANVQQVWGFSGGASQSFTGYDLSSMPQRKDLASVEPGKGYWVYALDTVTLTAMPSILLTGDVDMPPLQAQVMYTGANAAYLGRKVKLAGVEDSAADLNGNGILDDSETQDTLSFPIGVVRQPVIIGNDGAGAMNWFVSENCDWLSVEGDSSGTVAGSRAYVYLVVSRAGLAPGSYSDESVIITAGGVSKSVRVNMQVATVDGDFSGYASATKVNGKEIALGKVDMGLNVFVTTNTESGVRFKAVIDNDRSLLFPRDVFMNGVFYLGNSFSLTTSFSMPAGDRNAPPYDTFEHVDPANDQEGFGDRDWNTNGVLDVQNPFPFPVRRSVTLLGQRTDENTLAGSYLETIAGALPGNEKITVEGTFSLSRKSYSPTRRSIYNEQDSEYEVIGNPNATFERVITIAEAVQVNGVTTTLNIDFPKPAALTVTLTSPLGTVATLHNKGASVTAQQELSDFDGENGKGDQGTRTLLELASQHRRHRHLRRDRTACRRERRPNRRRRRFAFWQQRDRLADHGRQWQLHAYRPHRKRLQPFRLYSRLPEHLGRVHDRIGRRRAWRHLRSVQGLVRPGGNRGGAVSWLCAARCPVRSRCRKYECGRRHLKCRMGCRPHRCIYQRYGYGRRSVRWRKAMGDQRKI